MQRTAKRRANRRAPPAHLARIEVVLEPRDTACPCCRTAVVAVARHLDDGRIEIDNNRVERAMRPIALSRKNALFAGSDEGERTGLPSPR